MSRSKDLHRLGIVDLEGHRQDLPTLSCDLLFASSVPSQEDSCDNERESSGGDTLRDRSAGE